MPEPLGRVKACTECRQQKVGCDAYKDFSKPCTRCRTAGLPCIISKNFQRRKRQTKAQLQYELERLRKNGGGGDNTDKDSSGREVTVASASDAVPNPDREQLSTTTQKSMKDLRDNSHPHSHGLDNDTIMRNVDSINAQKPQSPVRGSHYATPISNNPTPSSTTSETKSRTLNDVVISGQVVKDCYDLFLKNYAPHLEGLFEQQFSPDERYDQCPLLFWAMVCVGSRRYTKDIQVYGQLEGPVFDMAFQSFLRATQPLLVILAALVLCSWPMTIDFIYKDPAQSLAGAAMHLAIQQGLHMYHKESDFITKSLQQTQELVPNPAVLSSSMARAIQMRDAALVFRTRVWVHCMIVFQSTSLCDGLPPTSLVPCFRKAEVYGEMGSLLPDTIAYRIRLHRIQITAINVISDSCDLEGKGSESHLTAMIAAFDDNIRHIAMPCNSNLYHFMRSTARLVVLGLHFVAQTEPDHTSMAQFYQVIRTVIRYATQLDVDHQDFTCHMPHYYIRITYYALHCLIRIYKSPLGERLDKSEAEESMRAGVKIMEKRSQYRNQDLGYQAVILITQLWGSTKAFVRGDQPQNGLRVDLRHRLIFNPLFDSFFWWRREFGPSTDMEFASWLKERRAQLLSSANETGAELDQSNALPPSAPGINGLSDGIAMDNFLPGFMNWDFSSTVQSDFYDLNAWLGNIDEGGSFEFQPWELPLGQR